MNEVNAFTRSMINVAPTNEKSIFQTLSKVEPLEVKWLWAPYVPLGMVTILEGDPGIGKSYLAMHLCALVSTGGSLPGGSRLRKQNVLYLGIEDDPAYTLRPRIDAMGGDAARIRFQAIHTAFDKEGMKLLRREIDKREPGLIVIDPLFSYVPHDTDLYRPNEIRALLHDVQSVASDAGAAVVAIRHLTKMRRDKAIHQGAGSVDVIATVRSSLLVGQHPDERDTKVIAHVKHNISEKGKSWMYRLRENIRGLPVVEWAGQCDLSADELLNASDPRATTSLKEAEKFLASFLEGGPKPAVATQNAAESLQISSRTLDRAKKSLGVKVRKRGERWIWSLSEK